MRRDQLEHAIRAATEVLAQDKVIIIGSQAILGTYDEDEIPERATVSVEVDIVPLEDDDAESLATVLDGAIGELSMFHATHGFYFQGVGRRAAVLPDGWADRIVPVVNDNTRGRTGLCLDPHDLCAAKCWRTGRRTTSSSPRSWWRAWSKRICCTCALIW